MLSHRGFGSEKESGAADRLDASADVLTDMMHASDKGIPQDLMNKAQCVVIVPNMKKAGFIFGAKYGRGFAMCRRRGGVGLDRARRLCGLKAEASVCRSAARNRMSVLLVMNESGMKHLLDDKFTLGGDATAAAGPVGRDASAQTDARCMPKCSPIPVRAGFLAGLALEGATLRPDNDADHELYGRDISNREILTGEHQGARAAEKLERALNRESARK